MPDGLVIDELQEEAKKAKGRYKLGEAVMVLPLDQWGKLNPITPIGRCSIIYYAMVFQLPKWGYAVRKVDEWMETSPSHAEYYGITMGQKQKLEQAIKTGLTSAAQSVADYELLRHDERKYREILDYFKMGKEEEHVLRSLFVDRVDAHTGEGYSMITMAKRWPTIITDFIRLVDEDVEKEAIMKKLDVSSAEATVLKTKNELYKEWKRLFFPELRDRYARIKNLVNARKKSMDEYREWLKPYITRYKMMAEATEKSPSSFIHHQIYAPGFGQAVGLNGIRIWAWQPYSPPEMHKPERTPLEPYDDAAKEWQEKIEKRYNVNFSEKDIRGMISDGEKKEPKWIDPKRPYYRVFDVKFEKTIFKFPGVPEEDDMDVYVYHWLVSLNMMLVHLMELRAREMAFDRYVKEIIGVREVEDEIRGEVEKEYPDLMEEIPKGKPERFQTVKKFRARAGNFGGRTRIKLRPVVRRFVKPGPYENNFEERITKMYLTPMGVYFGRFTDYMKWKMGVPGAPAVY